MTISLGFSAASTPPLSSGVEIDGSASRFRVQSNEGCSALLEWVERCPSAMNVHIVLDQVKEREDLRRMQRRLQAMGCKVTRRCEMTSV